MMQHLLLQVPPAPPASPLRSYYLSLENDLVGTTFFFSMFALLGGTLFFFLERGSVRWHANVTLAGIVCVAAGINDYRQEMYLNAGGGPTRFRYADWLFTVPVMCTQFYLLRRPTGAQPSALWRIGLAGLWMIGFGYFGETSDAYWSIVYGGVSTLGYLVIVYEIWFGALAKVAARSGDAEVVRAFTCVAYFVLIGWAVYPLGYVALPLNVFQKLHLDRNLVYNPGAVVNKLGFGLVIYLMARKAGRMRKHRRQQQASLKTFV